MSPKGNDMKLLVLGAGGIGGYYGGRPPPPGGPPPPLPLPPPRPPPARRRGVPFGGPPGGERSDARTVLAEDLRPGYDLVLFSCKAYDLDSAMDAIAPAMNGTCAVVPMLNGIAHLEKLAGRFGKGSVMGGTAQINVTLRGDGVVHHMDKLGRIVFGELDRSASARPKALADAFAKSQVDWKLSPDIELEMWEKIVFLCSLASSTCLFRANVGEIVAAPGGAAAMQRALDAHV